ADRPRDLEDSLHLRIGGERAAVAVLEGGEVSLERTLDVVAVDVTLPGDAKALGDLGPTTRCPGGDRVVLAWLLDDGGRNGPPGLDLVRPGVPVGLDDLGIVGLRDVARILESRAGGRGNGGGRRRYPIRRHGRRRAGRRAWNGRSRGRGLRVRRSP